MELASSKKRSFGEHDLRELEDMLETPIENTVNEDVLWMMENALGNAVHDLISADTPEKALHVVGSALKHMFVLGRWSVRLGVALVFPWCWLATGELYMHWIGGL